MSTMTDPTNATNILVEIDARCARVAELIKQKSADHGPDYAEKHVKHDAFPGFIHDFAC